MNCANTPYVVYKEHTLGYLFGHGEFLSLGILHGSVLKGGYDWKNGPISVPQSEMGSIREASEEDFASFRVTLPPDFKQRKLIMT